jgi:peptidyl-prolyl cis-trans isomerase SurA
MIETVHRRAGFAIGICALLCLGIHASHAQKLTGDTVDAERQQGGYPPSAPVQQPAPIPNSVLLDRVVAVINGDVILESDVLEEEQFVQLQPYHSPGDGTLKEQALQHLVNRTLILQQIKEQQNPLQVTPAELTAQLNDLRKHLPACANGKCESEAGWTSLLAAHGFTQAQFDHRWQQRVLVLKFIEQRFRSGIRISKPEILTYYNTYFVPQFQKRKLTAPPLASVSARIDEILLQQHVNGLLSEWLDTLKQEGSVAILDPQYGLLNASADEDNANQGDDQ